MEYQCILLNPNYRLGHDSDSEILFESNNLAECCLFVYEHFQKNKLNIAVWQPRTAEYRELYQNKRRDERGRFSSFENSVN